MGAQTVRAPVKFQDALQVKIGLVIINRLPSLPLDKIRASERDRVGIFGCRIFHCSFRLHRVELRSSSFPHRRDPFNLLEEVCSPMKRRTFLGLLSATTASAL